MPTRIVTARAPKRIRKPAKAGPKLSRVIVGKRAPEPKRQRPIRHAVTQPTGFGGRWSPA